ncbi:MAG TPA: hypothetical protein VGR55_02470 [Candidatus Acidoferrum sp.]|nr:hypothetical protein [Candidatus Acidoferrum sp.]
MNTLRESKMKRQIALALGAVIATSLVFSLGRKVQAAGPTFTAVDFPGACGTIATAINYVGTIVGDFAPTCKLPEVVHGYVSSQGTFTEFDFPGATFTRPLGINDAGEIVGLYRDSKQGKDHGFLLSGGLFTAIDFPGADQTHAIGIDSADRIFGSYCIGGNACYNPGESVHGFTLSGGAFTTIDFPGAISTEVWGQDRAGQIAGRYQDGNGVFHIFLRSNGSFVSIDFPGASETAPSFYGADGGFNAGGDIASGYCSAEPCANPSPSVHSFLLKDGQFTSFDPPGTLGSFALGMNSIDEIVGAYVGQDGHYHGYLRTP